MLQPKDTGLLNGYKTKTQVYACLQETHFRPKDTNRLKVRGWKKIFHANGNQKKAGVAILISDKTDFKVKKVWYIYTMEYCSAMKKNEIMPFAAT